MPWIAIGVGVVGGAAKIISRANANKKMRELNKKDPIYTANPLAAQRLSYARSLRDARMPGAAAVERNITGATGNMIANAQNNASNSSQVLALAGAAQGQEMQGFENLGMAEAQDQQRRMGNEWQAIEGQIAEEQNAFNSKLRQHGNKINMEGAIAQNQANSWSDVSNMGFSVANMANARGGFGKPK